MKSTCHPTCTPDTRTRRGLRNHTARIPAGRKDAPYPSKHCWRPVSRNGRQRSPGNWKTLFSRPLVSRFDPPDKRFRKKRRLRRAMAPRTSFPQPIHKFRPRAGRSPSNSPQRPDRPLHRTHPHRINRPMRPRSGTPWGFRSEETPRCERPRRRRSPVSRLPRSEHPEPRDRPLSFQKPLARERASRRRRRPRISSNRLVPIDSRLPRSRATPATQLLIPWKHGPPAER